MASTNSIFKKDCDTDLNNTVLDYPPKKLMLSVTQYCNLKCSHCSRQLEPELKGEMKKELLDRVIEGLFPHLDYVRVGGANLGEQTTYTHFNHLLEKAAGLKRNRKPVTALCTNGVLINSKNAKSIVECFDIIELSAEGVRQDYERVRGVGWSKFKKTVELLRRAEKQSGLDTKICLEVALTADNLPRLGGLFNLKGIDKITFGYFWPVFPSDLFHTAFFNMQSANHWIDCYKKLAGKKGIELVTPEKFQLSKEDFSSKNLYEIHSYRRKKCHIPWESVHIDYDGSVYGCCQKILLGRFKSDSDIMDIWNGRAYQNLRRKVNSKNYPFICKYCAEVVSPTTRFLSYFNPLTHYGLAYKSLLLKQKIGKYLNPS